MQSLANAVPFSGIPKSTTISRAKFAATLVFLNQHGSSGLTSSASPHGQHRARHLHQTFRRGLGELPLIAGTAIGTLAELAEATLAADKVVTF
jgi:hypothetical protein